MVGVVRDARFSFPITRIEPFVLLPFQATGPATLHIRTDGPPTALAAAIADVVHRRDPTMAVYGVTSMASQLRDGPALSGIRLGANVIGAFGALGLLLAAVGLYGVVAYSVTQRRQEFGIRTALGATSLGIVRLAIGRGMTLTLAGLGLGVVAAISVTPFTTGFLVGVDATDPVIFGATAILLAGVALVACLVPSRRAAAADPLAALKTD